MVTHHTALVYTMVLVSAADGSMTDPELQAIGEIARTLPVFKDYDSTNLTTQAADCAALLSRNNGLDAALDVIDGALPKKLRETAYALACDIAAADLRADQEELRLLEILRHRLKVGRLPAAAIERGARARHATYDPATD